MVGGGDGPITVALTLGRTPVATIGALLVAGFGGALLLITVQATLADHHGDGARSRSPRPTSSPRCLRRAGRRALARGADRRRLARRAAGLVRAAAALWLRGTAALAIEAPPPGAVAHGRLSGAFAIAAAMMFCTVAAEWCITAWGASFAEEAADVSDRRGGRR